LGRASLCCCLLLSALCLEASAATWSRQKSGTFAWLHAVFFVDERRGWAAGGKGALLSTEDGGASWKLRTPAPTEDALRDIHFVDEQNGWAVCERDWYRLKTKEEPRSYLLRTSDGGRTWARVEVAGADVDARLVGVRFAGREHGWAFGELGALYTTADGGRTWSRQRVPTRRLLLGATFLNPQQGWLVGAGPVILHTADGGATWREGQVVAQLADYALRGRVAGTGADATPSSAFEPLAARRGVRANAVHFADARRGWAVGTGGLVLATADGGRTWRVQESGTESDLHDVRFLDEREGWAVGGHGAVLHTTDGGATWRAERPVTPHTLERLFFAGRARGWAVGFGGTIIAFGDKSSSQ
jgi:photosystem II stability/assembly factor-like uncharacterized protein